MSVPTYLQDAADILGGYEDYRGDPGLLNARLVDELDAVALMANGEMPKSVIALIIRTFRQSNPDAKLYGD